MTTFILKKCECGIIYYTIKNQISLLEDGWKTTSKFWLIEDLKTRGTVKREYKAIFPGPPRPLQMSENIILSACHFYLDHTYQRLSVFNPPPHVADVMYEQPLILSILSTSMEIYAIRQII